MRALLATAFLCLTPAALAHEAASGWSYPFECCGESDCDVLAAERVRALPHGYLVDERFFVPPEEVRRSPDGLFHACFPTPERLLCFFAPPPSS